MCLNSIYTLSVSKKKEKLKYKTIQERIDKQHALRRDCIYSIEIVLEICLPGVHLHSTNKVFDTHNCFSSAG